MPQIILKEGFEHEGQKEIYAKEIIHRSNGFIFVLGYGSKTEAIFRRIDDVDWIMRKDFGNG